MAKKVGNLLSYYPEKMIGEGRFGTVYEGRFRATPDGKENTVAVKRILKRHGQDESMILKEVELVEKAGEHPNILHVIATEKNDDFL